jgi:hypothetical protein
MTYKTEQQHGTEIPSCGTELHLRSILWPKHGNFNANDEYFWSLCYNKEVSFQLPDNMNKNEGSCNIPGDSTSRLSAIKG